ncbi:hypothetical protein [Bradyrhizobium prioriisuperbiae]|uniref:hypothetical protein n=1 Tax=Bradyrhizobium prioriisuperbiae TaxID=2854389 RepID=UPI0028EA8EE4|nr:hypothetical protein [Bradyrhizobium prioritasuperba]
MNDLTSTRPIPSEPDSQVHLSLRLLEAFRKIRGEPARREVIALVERLAEADSNIEQAKAN